MTEEFENAKKWVEENEICRFEGKLQDGDDKEFKKFLALTERYLKQRGAEGAIQRKIFNLSIELDYIERHKRENQRTIVISGNNLQEYQILATYILQSEVVKSIIENIEYGNLCINDVEKFRDYRKRYFFAGFLYIFLYCSNHKILYHFEPIDSEYSYFSMIVTVKS
ncbi:MAG: hypothetical protein MUE81_08835 [Thermoflexibacter sp.]|jgi:hypothetical protein|nr:hypothetical protein [Thermoflexibacter sp.]